MGQDDEGGYDPRNRPTAVPAEVWGLPLHPSPTGSLLGPLPVPSPHWDRAQHSAAGSSSLGLAFYCTCSDEVQKCRQPSLKSPHPYGHPHLPELPEVEWGDSPPDMM
jgi:hypothetical protein